MHGYENVNVLRELIPAPGYLSVQNAMDRPFVTGFSGLGKLYAEFFPARETGSSLFMCTGLAIRVSK